MESDLELKARMYAEHLAKYSALADKLGRSALLTILQAHFIRQRIVDALASGDEHLNTIPLAKWDEAAGVPSQMARKDCPTCGQKMPWSPTIWPYGDLNATARDLNLPWHNAPALSLSERVSVLKYMAREWASPTGGRDA